MNTKWHKEVLEALGMLASKSSIINKLNKANAKSDDPKLRDLTSILISEVQSANTNTKVSAPKELKNGVPTAREAILYCNEILGYE